MKVFFNTRIKIIFDLLSLNETKERTIMALHAGDQAMQTGEVRCQKCNSKLHLINGQKIPKCPNCGGDTFEKLNDTRDLENF
jgi:predicted RNA-binding Zn-ribbon protein involved in translation (DUF1610 family)